METVAQGVNWHSASAFLKQKTNSTGQPRANTPYIFRTGEGTNQRILGYSKPVTLL